MENMVLDLQNVLSSLSLIDILENNVVSFKSRQSPSFPFLLPANYLTTDKSFIYIHILLSNYITRGNQVLCQIH